MSEHDSGETRHLTDRERFEAGLVRHAASGAPNPFVRDDPCAFGDPYCPCRDGDACHYVDAGGSPAMTPPGEERDSEGALARAMAEAWGRSDPEDQDDIWLFCARVAAAALPDPRPIAAENVRLREAILDIDAHATPFGTDDDGFVTGGYLISVGSLHRALGVVGHTSIKCRSCEASTHDCEEAGPPSPTCPLCLHPRASHMDGRASQSLNTMGCASCLGCEDNRSALTASPPSSTPYLPDPSLDGLADALLVAALDDLSGTLDRLGAMPADPFYERAPETEWVHDDDAPSYGEEDET